MQLKSILIILAVLLFFSCNKDDQKYKLKINTYNGNFTGTYTIDGDKQAGFQGALYTANVYQYENEVDISDNILIDVIPEPNTLTVDAQDTLVTNIICRIYLGKDLVYDKSTTVTAAALQTFKYEPGGTNDSTAK